MNNQSNFTSKSASLYNTLGIIEWGAFKIMAIGTGIMFGDMGYQYATNNMPEYTYYTVMGSILLGYISIDLGLGSLLRYFYDNRFSTEELSEADNKVRTALFRFIFGLVILRFITSWVMSFMANTEVVDYASEDFNAEYFINTVTNQDSLRNASIALLKSDYERLEKGLESKIKKARKEGHKLVEMAINQGDTWQRKSYRQNKFSWLESRANPDKKDHRYAASIRQAWQDSAALEVAIKEEAKVAKELYVNTVKDTSTLAAKKSILKLGEQTAAELEADKSNKYNYMTIGVSFFGIVGWLVCYVRSLMRKVGVDYKRERTFSHVLNSILNSWIESILIWLEKWLKVDLDGNGVVGTVGPPTPSEKKNGILSNLKGMFGIKQNVATSHQVGASSSAASSVSSPDTDTSSGVVDTNLDTTDTHTKPDTDTPDTDTRVVVEGFKNRKKPSPDTPIEADTDTDTKPPSLVPTGHSAVSEKTTNQDTTSVSNTDTIVVHGIGYVIHNGHRRGEEWIRKQLQSNETRRKEKIRKGKDTSTQDYNIRLFSNYLLEIRRIEQESEQYLNG